MMERVWKDKLNSVGGGVVKRVCENRSSLSLIWSLVYFTGLNIELGQQPYGLHLIKGKKTNKQTTKHCFTLFAV